MINKILKLLKKKLDILYVFSHNLFYDYSLLENEPFLHIYTSILTHCSPHLSKCYTHIHVHTKGNSTLYDGWK